MARSERSTTRKRSSSSLSGRLVVVLGDQLDADAALFDAIESSDTVLMMEVAAESTEVPSHVQRTTLFLSAMRHYAAALSERGVNVRYITLDDPENTGTFKGEIGRAIDALEPSEVVCTLPGEWRILQMLKRVGEARRITVTILPDRHFLTTPEEFANWAEGRKSLTMEYFYREQRRRTGYLMDGSGRDAKPIGGRWNFDKLNRLPFGKEGPSPRPPNPIQFEPDRITREVIKTIRDRLPSLPGKVESFAWPVTRAQALKALDDFIEHRLGEFGPYEDAMWLDESILYHSALSSALNLKLLNPRECCERAVRAYHEGEAPLQSVEAFVRQIIGWREFIRGVYWLEGRDYAERNSLDSRGALPEFYWTAETDMACMKACVGQVLDDAYAHHIQRLMVMGNFALISGVEPRAISDWFLGLFVDGVDWVTLPNTLGMVMHADQRADASAGNTGVVGTKPYAASGRYIQRMSNYCIGCRYDPRERTGADACPFTVFYWDFLHRSQERLEANPRLAMSFRNLRAIDKAGQTQITIDAAALRKRFGIERE